MKGASSGRGRFITVEGVEGCGKTTNIAFMEAYLREAGIPLVTTREPGGTPLAEELRKLLLIERDEVVDAHAELLMVFAARAQHLSQVIVPALESGQWVLCDRFTDATFAYQGGGRGLPLDVIGKLEHIVQGGQQPDKTFFLDLEVSQGLARAKKRGVLDRFEQENLQFFNSVREAYWQRIKRSPQRFAVIDASVELHQVQQQIQSELEGMLLTHKEHPDA